MKRVESRNILRQDLIERGKLYSGLLNGYGFFSADVSMIEHILIMENHHHINKMLEKDYILIGMTNNGQSIEYHLGYIPQLQRQKELEKEQYLNFMNILREFNKLEEDKKWESLQAD